MDHPIITVEKLRKTYGSITAVNDISFNVTPGTIFGLVGPNGAGKSTTIECIEGLRRPTAGRVLLLGQSPFARRQSVFSQVGVLLQENELLPPRLRTRELLDLYRSFYPNPLSVEEILDICGLDSHLHVMTRQLSGGQRRRLAVALACIGRPRLLILDEPTSGLDPQARYNIWRALLRYRDDGGTIFLSTHYMEEASEFCDDLCLLDHGVIQVQGNPVQLLAEHNMKVLLRVPERTTVTQSALLQLEGVSQVEKVDDHWHVYSHTDAVYGPLKQLTSLEVLEMRPARLEDLYLMHTGRTYRPGT